MSAHAVCNASGDRASLEEGDRRKQCTYETPTPAFRSGGGRLTRTQKETPRKLPAKRASGQRELSVYEKTVGMLMKAGKRACEMPTDSEGMKVEQDEDIEMQGNSNEVEEYHQTTTILDYFQRRHK
jgi:hypothetical protein